MSLTAPSLTKADAKVTVVAASGLPQQVTSWAATIVASCHKEAAFVLGALCTSGVIALPAGRQGGWALLAYAVAAKAADYLAQK